mgnify:CR=1 FL=1
MLLGEPARTAYDLHFRLLGFSIRIHPGPSEAFPVRAEIEIGRRNAEPDQLPFLVAKHLLEAQGAVVEIDGRMTRIDLRCIVAEREVG